MVDLSLFLISALAKITAEQVFLAVSLCKRGAFELLSTDWATGASPFARLSKTGLAQLIAACPDTEAVYLPQEVLPQLDLAALQGIAPKAKSIFRNIGSADVAAAVAVCAATKSLELFPVPASRSEEPEAEAEPVTLSRVHGDWEILPELADKQLVTGSGHGMHAVMGDPKKSDYRIKTTIILQRNSCHGVLFRAVSEQEYYVFYGHKDLGRYELWRHTSGGFDQRVAINNSMAPKGGIKIEANKPMQWEVIVRGRTFELIVNGVSQCKLNDPLGTHKLGQVGLWAWDSDVTFEGTTLEYLQPTRPNPFLKLGPDGVASMLALCSETAEALHLPAGLAPTLNVVELQPICPNLAAVWHGITAQDVAETLEDYRLASPPCLDLSTTCFAGLYETELAQIVATVGAETESVHILVKPDDDKTSLAKAGMTVESAERVASALGLQIGGGGYAFAGTYDCKGCEQFL
eukprot:SAG11_NODE_254_length_11587_cov_4.312913_5_plen_463_part_00